MQTQQKAYRHTSGRPVKKTFLILFKVAIGIVIVFVAAVFISAYVNSKGEFKKYYSPDRKFAITLQFYGSDFGGDYTHFLIESNDVEKEITTAFNVEKFDVTWNSDRTVSINCSGFADLTKHPREIEINGETVHIVLNSPAATSIDGKYIARMGEDEAWQKIADSEQSSSTTTEAPGRTGEIFVEKVDLSKRWLIAVQDAVTREEVVDFEWLANNKLHLRCNSSVHLKTDKITDGNTQIDIELLPTKNASLAREHERRH